MEDALKEYRRNVESLYVDKVDIYTISMEIDDETKAQKTSEKMIVENQPCRLSFSESAIPIDKGLHFSTERKDKLFIAPEINVGAGAKVKVTKSTGQVFEYDAIGEIKPYPTHNEYSLLGVKVSL